jgi:hypothetical protein
MVDSYPDDIHEKKIDQLINFYRGRLYLKDSEFKILSDIADDAENMLSFLEDKKELLIRELKRKNMVLKPYKINGFVLNKARYSKMGIG